MSEKRTQERPEALETPLAEGRGDGRRGELAAQQVSELGTAFSRVTESMAESRRAQFEAKFADSAQYTPMVHAQVDEFLNAVTFSEQRAPSDQGAGLGRIWAIWGIV